VNYFLIERFLDGGGLRAFLGLNSILLFFFYIFLSTYGRGIRHSKNILLFIATSIYLLVVGLFSVVASRDIFYIVYELYPLIEACSYFLIGYYLVALGLKKELIISLFLFCLINVFFDIFITVYYYLNNLKFAYTVDVGVLVNRIPDSLLPLYLAITLVMTNFFQNRYVKYLNRLLVVIILVLLLICFWRTLMISGFVVLTVFMLKNKDVSILRTIKLYFIPILLVISIVFIVVEKNTGLSTTSMIIERVTSAFDNNKSRSIEGRLLDAQSVMLQVAKNPVIGSGFGGLYEDQSGGKYYLGSTSNYLIRFIAHFGIPIFLLMIAIFAINYINSSKLKKYLELQKNYNSLNSRVLIQLSNYVSLAVLVILVGFPSVLHYPMLSIMFLIIGATVWDRFSYRR